MLKSCLFVILFERIMWYSGYVTTLLNSATVTKNTSKYELVGSFNKQSLVFIATI